MTTIASTFNDAHDAAHARATTGDADHHHDPHDAHADDGPHSSLSSYIVGFLLSAVLTAIPFGLVMFKIIEDRQTAVVVLTTFAVVQMLVHMVCFLHVTPKLESGWTLLSTTMSVVFVVIAIAGTLWIILQTNTLMMPGHEEHEAAAAERRAAAKAQRAAPPAATQAAPASQEGNGTAGTN